MRHLVVVAACAAWIGGTPAEADDDTLAKARARGALEVAVYDNFPPYSYKADGVPMGADVDLANSLAAQLGLRARLRFITAGEGVSDDLRNNVWKGHYLGGGVAEVMLHVPADPVFASGQGQSLIFGEYFHESVTIAHLAKHKLAITTPLALADRKVGVEIDTISDHYMSSAYGGRLRAAAIRAPSLAAAVSALSNGDVDAVVGPKGELQGLFAMARLHDVQYRDLPLNGMFSGAWDIGFAVRKADGDALRAALDGALEDLRADGTLAAIFARHDIVYVPPARRIVTANAQ